MATDFTHADHTIIVSDIHLADAEPPHSRHKYWKLFKRPEYFIDRSFRTFLRAIRAKIPGRIELVLNGDIFDFDSVMARPGAESPLQMHVSWLERARGLASEETKSRFKIAVILDDHPVWVEALREFLLAGNRLIFVIGNHDIELHWPTVQADILKKLDLPQEARENVRFCEWFYISNQDTLVEHGNQYDAYSLTNNPINPLIRKGSRIYVRIPFGNLAGKFMLNGMGLMNPHAESSYIKGSIFEYFKFYFKYVIRAQPFLLATWFWSAMVTLGYSISEGLLPAMTDPLTIDDRVGEIAQRSNASPGMVWALRELQAHPAIFNPLKILRELWLDRAIILALIVFLAFQFFSIANVVVAASKWWFISPILLLLPIFIFYARSVQSEVASSQVTAFQVAPLSARLTRVKRVIQGHTHRELHILAGGIEYLNTGTWSPAYHDVECTQAFGRKCFAWIKPGPEGEARVAELHEWREPEMVLLEKNLGAG